MNESDEIAAAYGFHFKMDWDDFFREGTVDMVTVAEADEFIQRAAKMAFAEGVKMALNGRLKQGEKEADCKGLYKVENRASRN